MGQDSPAVPLRMLFVGCSSSANRPPDAGWVERFYHSTEIAQENSGFIHKETTAPCYTFTKSFVLKGTCSLYEPARLCRTFPQKNDAFAAVRMAGAGGAGHRPQLSAAGRVRGVGHRAQPHSGGQAPAGSRCTPESHRHTPF